MPRFWRSRPTLPADLAEELKIGRGDRVLAWSRLAGGGGVAGLLDGIRVVTPRGQHLARTWVDVDHASWDQNSSMLLVWWVGSRQPTPLELSEQVGDLPELVRERVQSSVLLTLNVPVPGRSSARVALRRDGEGKLSTQVLLPPGVREDEPDVKAALQQAIDQLWAEASDNGAAYDPAARPPSI
ncbi:hypothetical protein ACIB24_08905 [Spongisporangium articulatum]|uniref:Uncharacterized protein n=1 Tax=Spongisporangium articulatum TaxID=3362603 RepID=A0ABW8ALD8_9ACTN